MPLFGQILAAIYQADIVEEEDIRHWHSLSESKGEGRKPGVETDNFVKCWTIGSHMIDQFDAQGSDSEESSEDEEEDHKKGSTVPERQDAEDETTTETETETGSEQGTETESEKETEEDHPRRRNTIVASGPPSGVGGAAIVNRPTSTADSESERELTDSTEARDAGVSASDDSGSTTNTEDEESEED